ncbi:MAG: ABC transporter permease [Oscillospiraceae bacterium]|nr:ABC transporter permease [Oscillospiraceae bacterium]
MKKGFREILKRFGIYFVLLLMFVISSFVSDVFFSTSNILNILSQVAVCLIIACGMEMLIISGNVDLSPGYLVALLGCICVSVLNMTGSLLLGIAAAIIVGMIAGFLNGFIVTKWNLAPFIVTLAMMQIAKGMALIVVNGKPIYPEYDFSLLGQQSIGILPVSVMICILCLAVTFFILKYSKFGRYLYAIGGNKDAALASGVKVKKIIIVNFMIMGLFSGIGSSVYMSRINSGSPVTGPGIEFDAIIAVVLGGTSFTGGTGGIAGTIIGALIIGVLNNVLNLMNIQPYWQSVIKGLIIFIAIIMDANTKLVKVRVKESKESRDSKDSKDSGDSREITDNRESRESTDNRESKDSKDNRESTDNRDSKDSQDSQDSQDQ